LEIPKIEIPTSPEPAKSRIIALLPKFVSGGAAMYHELRKRGTRRAQSFDVERFCRGARLLPKCPARERGVGPAMARRRSGSPRTASAEPATTSDSSRSCAASGLVLRQIMPMVRDGWGSLKRATDTDAERVSTATAISGIKVTPMPALTICTSVDSELASSASCGGDDRILQNERA